MEEARKARGESKESKGESMKGYKRKYDGIPDIPNWPDQMKETGIKLLLKSWMDDEVREAHLFKRTRPQDYLKICKLNLEHNTKAYQRESQQLEEGQLKPTSETFIFRLLYERKIEFYKKEIENHSKHYNAPRANKYIGIIDELLKNHPELKDDTMKLKRLAIEKGDATAGEKVSPQHVGRLIKNVLKMYYPSGH